MITIVYGHFADFNQASAPFNNSILEAFDESFKNIFQSSILNVSVLTFKNKDCNPLGPDTEPLDRCSNHNFNTTHHPLGFSNVAAIVCSFFICVQDYHGYVDKTIFTETVLNSTPIMALGPPRPRICPPPFLHIYTPCVING